MTDNIEIDNLLGKTSIEPPSLDFENRIISAAFEREMHQTSFLNIFVQLLAPKPVMTYLMFLVIGVTIGLYAPAFNGDELKSKDVLELSSDLLFEEVDFI